MSLVDGLYLNSEIYFRGIYSKLLTSYKEVRPRGLLVREAENFTYVLPPYVRFCNFESRKLKLDYIKEELRWYLKGQQDDLSICKHAKIWKECVTNGKLYSNYGKYWFRTEGKGIWWVVNELIDDPDSRRAVIPMLSMEHTFPENKDVVCTAYVGFRIRGGELNMSVRMRSQDAVYGFGNDLPAFSILQEIVCRLIEPYHSIKMGTLHGCVDSFHVYEPHFELVAKMATTDPYEFIDIPRISNSVEALTLIDPETFPLEESFHDIYFYQWLYPNLVGQEIHAADSTDS